MEIDPEKWNRVMGVIDEILERLRLLEDAKGVALNVAKMIDQVCPRCGYGMLRQFTGGKFGTFVGCDKYKETGCNYKINVVWKK
jgi:ssDNA-binding Zn-finger/Zn-ribbon topoisomerase 1